MLDSVKRWLFILLLLTTASYLLYEAVLYRHARQFLPVGMVMADLPVAGLTLDQAMEQIQQRYLEPIKVYHRAEMVEINPQDVGFILDDAAMRGQAEMAWQQQDFWYGYMSHLLQRPFQPVTIPLSATHDRARLRQMLQVVANFSDKPARPPQILAESVDLQKDEGQAGYLTDIEASLLAVEESLYRPEQREAYLVVVETPAPELSLTVLADVIGYKLQSFSGTGSVYVMDLQTGEEISINGDLALPAISILKIAIFVEAYRALSNPPTLYEEELFYNTAARSDNYSANLLLHIVAGQDNTYRGADILTESMRRLGLINTFMAVPYGVNIAHVPSYRQTTYITPANSQADGRVELDPTMQTTAEEIGTLLAMIYYCSKGGGALLAVYPDQFTPQECQAIIDLMILNEEGNLIRFGVPTGTPVSHKHGWARGTHADAGIVFTPGGDYVLVEYLHLPGDWLVSDYSFPILREVARAVYNYFNLDNPYTGDALFERERFDPEDPFFQQQDSALPDEEEPEPPPEGG
jgi:beta-lactamase class A